MLKNLFQMNFVSGVVTFYENVLFLWPYEF